MQNRLLRIVGGILLLCASLVALFAPITTGVWSLQFLALIPLAIGLVDLRRTIIDPDIRYHPTAYATGVLAIAVALFLYLSPSFAATGVVVFLLGCLAFDGVVKVGRAVLRTNPGVPFLVGVANGCAGLILALVGWILWRRVGIDVAIGVAIAGYTAATGWQLLLAPSRSGKADFGAAAPNSHPDAKLGLGEHDLFGVVRERRVASEAAVRQSEIYWFLAIAIVLFVVHLGRMQSGDTWLGLVSPLVAIFGDIVMALLLGGLLVLPLRLIWRRLTRPLERRFWKARLDGHDRDMDALPRLILTEWTGARFAFSESLRRARVSLPSAALLVIRLGLPLAILFVAINPIWGFTWYFNTESWASAFYQKVTALRVDTWRENMANAVAEAFGTSDADLFRVSPPGIDSGDFSLIVIGDPGEGDASQYSLVDQYKALGRRDDVKFLIISSDVIYPAGAMVDYENNFYMPFKGFDKPIYAIPGNHDWFDALEGFNANFLEPEAARTSLTARANTDFRLTSTDEGRIDRLLERSARLQELYRIDIARQRAPFFEIQTSDFALLAIDTGIRRTIDDRQRQWLEGALERSRGKFAIAVVGHPKYAAGVDTSEGDAEFSELYATLEAAGIHVMIAGDTHAFEYYLQEGSADGSGNPTHYFMNGGGGAYLSIGGALAWPSDPEVAAWAYYPSSDAIRTKLDTETPLWKRPFWEWIKRFGAWPISIETLSGMFDFNNAPFFQSFLEVRVERSKNRIVFVLHGVNGPLSWSDLQISDPGLLGVKGDDPVEFILDMSLRQTEADLGHSYRLAK